LLAGSLPDSKGKLPTGGDKSPAWYAGVIELLDVWRQYKPKPKPCLASQSKTIRFYHKILRLWTNQNSAMRGCGGWQGAGQDSRSMKPRFRNANLLITHVLESCVKLLAVLHISSAKGQLVDLSVEIATGRRRMIDMISTLGPPAVA